MSNFAENRIMINLFKVTLSPESPEDEVSFELQLDSSDFEVANEFSNGQPAKIPTTLVALDKNGHFDISDDVKQKMYFDHYGTDPLLISNESNGFEYFDYRQFNIIGSDIFSRTDENLIKSILHVGLDRANGSCSSIYLKKVPTALVHSMKIRLDSHQYEYSDCSEYPYFENIECDIDNAYRLIRKDKTIVDIRQRMLEIDFSHIVFKNFYDITEQNA